eukprot:m.20953 g.20953  ORF g.20953 m.20953 type:complete len:246 (-) comp5304_c0_seq1:278-1015(-)
MTDHRGGESTPDLQAVGEKELKEVPENETVLQSILNESEEWVGEEAEGEEDLVEEDLDNDDEEEEREDAGDGDDELADGNEDDGDNEDDNEDNEDNGDDKREEYDEDEDEEEPKRKKAKFVASKVSVEGGDETQLDDDIDQNQTTPTWYSSLSQLGCGKHLIEPIIDSLEMICGEEHADMCKFIDESGLTVLAITLQELIRHHMLPTTLQTEEKKHLQQATITTTTTSSSTTANLPPKASSPGST